MAPDIRSGTANLQALTHDCNMKSLFLIASLLTWDLALAQLSVGLGLNLTVLAATCNQEPTRGLVGLINALPLVTGILACSTFNRKYVTATGRRLELRDSGKLALREN